MVLKISGFGQSEHVDYMYVILFIVCCISANWGWHKEEWTTDSTNCNL